jgi:cytochrome c
LNVALISFRKVIMRIVRRVVVLAACLAVVSLTSVSAKPERVAPERAMALVSRAVTYLKDHGKSEAARAFNDPKGAFVEGELYIFVLDANGRYVAYGADPMLVGADVHDLVDAEGTPIVQQMIERTKGKPDAMIEYVWLNRPENKVEHKRSYVIREDDWIIGAGYYTDD